MADSTEKLAELLQLLKNTKENEIDCDVFSERMAAFAEIATKRDFDEFELYQHHLDLCAGCAESFALLKKIVDEERLAL